MLNLNEIKTGKVIQVNSEPYLVTKIDHHKMGRGGAVLKTRLRSLINGSILDKTFQGNEKAEEADIEKKKINFLYKNGTDAYFMDNETYEQFSLSLEQIGGKQKFLKDGTDVDILYFQGKPVTIDLPVKVDFRVVNAPPAIKGNSAGSVTKMIEIETGAKVNVPLFVNEGDIIRVNTETGEYIERV
jgi:elongation factor P